jgi:hypothetical protein
MAKHPSSVSSPKRCDVPPAVQDMEDRDSVFVYFHRRSLNNAIGRDNFKADQSKLWKDASRGAPRRQDAKRILSLKVRATKR